MRVFEDINMIIERNPDYLSRVFSRDFVGKSFEFMVYSMCNVSCLEFKAFTETEDIFDIADKEEGGCKNGEDCC